MEAEPVAVWPRYREFDQNGGEATVRVLRDANRPDRVRPVDHPIGRVPTVDEHFDELGREAVVKRGSNDET